MLLRFVLLPVLLVSASVSLPPRVLAQRSAGDSGAVLSRQADSALLDGTREGMDRAIAKWTVAAALYSRTGDPGRAAIAHSSAGTAFRLLGRPDSSLARHRLA